MPDKHDIRALERAEREATPGPWRWEFRAMQGEPTLVRPPKDQPHDTVSMSGREDGELIALARNALPDLLAVVRAAKRMEWVIGFVRDHYGDATIEYRDTELLEESLSRFTGLGEDES